ncbi:MAG: rhodanese-like domain-containing protein [Carnobacterium sp.]|uniref:rhodanese-like domain-containing protein n=1 Tax=Carnobacterium sp. TaxID=48221 RepID=UPI003C7691A9
MFFKKVPSISTAELEKKLGEKPQIIDVREPHEFIAGHITGAKNVPLGKIANHATKGTTYVICQSGMRSKRATKQLLAKGADVVNVRSGMSSWTGSVRGGKL